MCNLYSVIRDLFGVKHDRSGDLPHLPAIFPDQRARSSASAPTAGASSS